LVIFQQINRTVALVRTPEFPVIFWRAAIELWVAAEKACSYEI